MSDEDDPVVESGWVSAPVRAEHPGLSLHSIVAPGTPRRSPPELRQRLSLLSSRFSGAHAIALRSKPIPHAYRVFYRHIGLDPDAIRSRVAAEEAAMRRLMAGGFESLDIVQDAVLLAVVETGVPVWALDADRVLGAIGVRQTEPHERTGHGEHADELPPGSLVVADDAGVVAVLFGQISAERRPTRQTTRLRIFALQVDGVPSLHIQEALWECAAALDAG